MGYPLLPTLGGDLALHPFVQTHTNRLFHNRQVKHILTDKFSPFPFFHLKIDKERANFKWQVSLLVDCETGP
jgi:hypothetical protein